MPVVTMDDRAMGVGSFLASASEKNIEQRKIEEEKFELKNFPDQEKTELLNFYLHEGWPEKLATDMAKYASQNHGLILKEMMVKELKVFPQKLEPFKNGVAMFLAYLIGGFIPLFGYFIFSFNQAIWLSVIITLLGLFILGVAVAKISVGYWLKNGLKMLILGGLALLAGTLMSQLAKKILLK